MSRTVSTPDYGMLDGRTNIILKNCQRIALVSKKKSPELKEHSNAKALESSFAFLRFWTRCPPAFRSWRRAKIVGLRLFGSSFYAPLPSLFNCARALHVHNVTQVIHLCSTLQIPLWCTHVPSLVSLAQNFPDLEDPTSMKFSAPGARSMPLT